MKMIRTSFLSKPLSSFHASVGKYTSKEWANGTGIYYGLFTDRNYDIAIQQFIQPEKTKTYRVYVEDNRIKKM